MPNARNVGAKKASGKILIFVDDDVKQKPTLIENYISIKTSDVELFELVLSEETIDGSFFVNLNTLIDIEPVFTFVIEPRVADSSGVTNLSTGKIRVEKFKFIRSSCKN